MSKHDEMVAEAEKWWRTAIDAEKQAITNLRAYYAAHPDSTEFTEQEHFDLAKAKREAAREVTNAGRRWGQLRRMTTTAIKKRGWDK